MDVGIGDRRARISKAACSGAPARTLRCRVGEPGRRGEKLSEFNWSDLGASAESVADGLVRAVMATTERRRDSELRMAELRAIPLPGIEIVRAKLLAQSRLGPGWGKKLDTRLLHRDLSRTPRKLRFDGRRWYVTTSIRILEPVDPRQVWAAVRAIIEAPADYQWLRFAPGTEGIGPNGVWVGNSDGLWYSDIPGVGIDPIGGAAAAVMFYGGEGSVLDDSECADFPQWETPPPAYVELVLYNGERDRHDEFAEKLIAWAGGSAAELDHYTGRWKIRTTPRFANAGII